MDGPGEKQGGMGTGIRYRDSRTESQSSLASGLPPLANIEGALTSLTHSGPWAHLWHSTQQTALACVPQVIFGNVWRLLWLPHLGGRYSP